MEGVSSFATRMWFWQTSGIAYAGTPFLRVTAGYPAKRISRFYAPEIFVFQDQMPYKLRPQIMASSVDDFCRIAEYVLTKSSVIEINCGCPAPKVVGHGAGSSILKDFEKFSRFNQDIVDRLGENTLIVKMRTGFEDDLAFRDLVSAISELKLNAVVIHGRTKIQGYKGKANWEHIRYAAQRIMVPVVGSGDICDLKTYRNRMKSPIQEAIIGRGLLRNPWMLHEISEQKPVKICFQALVLSLKVWVNLHAICLRDFLNKSNHSFEWVEKFFLKVHAGNDAERWQVLNQGLKEYVDTKEYSRREIGMLKMLWGYLRSSLPEPFFAPLLLRSKTVQQFFEGLEKIFCEYSLGSMDDLLKLEFQPHYNWIYGGEKKPTVDEDSKSMDSLIL